MSGQSLSKEDLKSAIGTALNAIDRRAPELTFDQFQAAYENVLAEHRGAAIELGIEHYLQSLVASRACGMAFLYWDQPYCTVKPLHDRMALIPPYAAERHLLVKWPLWCRYLIHTGHLAEARSVLEEFTAFSQSENGCHWEWAPEWIESLQQMLGDASAGAS